MALDESGDSLREAMRWIDVRTERGGEMADGGEGGAVAMLRAPGLMGRGEGGRGGLSSGSSVGSVGGRSAGSSGGDGEDVEGGEDYFSSASH